MAVFRLRFCLLTQGTTTKPLGICVTVLRNTPTSGGTGSGWARNRCVEFSLGQFLCLLDADDVMHPRRLQAQYDAAVSHQGPEHVLIGCLWESFPDRTPWTEWHNTLRTQDQMMAFRFREVSLPQPTWFLSRQCFDGEDEFLGFLLHCCLLMCYFRCSSWTVSRRARFRGRHAILLFSFEVSPIWPRFKWYFLLITIAPLFLFVRNGGKLLKVASEGPLLRYRIHDGQLSRRIHRNTLLVMQSNVFPSRAFLCSHFHLSAIEGIGV